MKLGRILAITRKEYIHIVRDWRSMVMAIGVPLFLLILFGYTLKLDVDHVPLMIWDQSNTPASRAFIAHFSGSRYFTVKGYADNYAQLERALDTNEATLVMVVPARFSESIDRGNFGVVQLIADGSDSNTATLALGYAEGITQAYSKTLTIDKLQRLGRPLPPPALNIANRIWYNADVESQNNIIPGLIAVIMMVISALLTSLTIAREWEKGTMEPLLATPITVSELIIGKMIPYFIIGMVDVLLIVLVGEFVFSVPLRGSIFLLFVFAAIFLVGSLSLGMLISIRTKNQLLASQSAMIMTFLPSFLLSGFMTAINNMPVVVQWVTYLVPARYFVTLLKGIYLKGVGLSVLYAEAGFLFIFATAMFLAANASFKKKWISKEGR